MDKKTFLLNLQHALSVLEEEELQDIISEYEQHIDLKVKNGLTEEEAIADFGTMSELTTEILEAYHVRADYAASALGRNSKRERIYGKTSEVISDGLKKVNQSAESLNNLNSLIVRMGKAARTAIAAVWTWMRRIAVWGKGVISQPFQWAWRAWDKHRQQGMKKGQGALGYYHKKKGNQGRTFMEKRRHDINLQEVGRSGAGERGGILHMLGRGIRSVFHGCIQAAIWCIRFGWNVCCVGISLMIACFGLFCLYGLGVLVVLLAQNYPLLGITVGCMGLVLCTFSMTVFVFNLRWVSEGRKQARSEKQNRKIYRIDRARREVFRKDASKKNVAERDQGQVDSEREWDESGFSKGISTESKSIDNESTENKGGKEEWIGELAIEVIGKEETLQNAVQEEHMK